MSLSTLDLLVVVAYFAGIIAAGLMVARRHAATGEMYFLAGRALRWPVVGAALFASNISTIHLVGLAEGGYKHGLVIGNFEWMATFTLILLALIFAPFYFRSRISTLPEFLERRYSRLARSVMAGMAIVAALLIHIGISLYAGAVVLREFFGVGITASIAIISISTAVYTVVGGLRAVVVTETIQTALLLLGAVLVTGLGIAALPGAGIRSWADLESALPPRHLGMLHSSNADGYAWYAILLGYPILGIWYWCTDQTIVQRVLGARSERDAQHGALFAGLLKILPVFLMVLPGTFAYVLFRDTIGTNASQAFPVMINRLVPDGLRGLLAAGLLAALMSTIAAALNSVGTLVALDVVKQFRPRTSDRTLVRIGGASAVVLMFLAMLWSTQGGRFGSIFEAINKMPAQFLAPPIATVFLWGVFFRRGTNGAALATLFLGFGLGIVAFLLDLPAFGETQWITDPDRGLGISFMMQAWWGFCGCSLIYFIVSRFTPAPAPSQVEGITWEHPWAVVLGRRLSGATDPRALAGVLLVGMAILYAIFR